MIKTILKLFTIKIKLSYKKYYKKLFTKLIKNDSFSNSVLKVLKSGDALTTSGKLFQILGAWYRQELSPKRVVLTFDTFKMSFPLKAHVVSRNAINSFKLSGFDLLFTSLKTDQRILLNLCSIRVPLPKSLRSSSYVVCLCQKANRTALSFTFSSFSAELLLQ